MIQFSKDSKKIDSFGSDDLIMHTPVRVVVDKPKGNKSHCSLFLLKIENAKKLTTEKTMIALLASQVIIINIPELSYNQNLGEGDTIFLKLVLEICCKFKDKLHSKSTHLIILRRFSGLVKSESSLSIEKILEREGISKEGLLFFDTWRVFDLPSSSEQTLETKNMSRGDLDPSFVVKCQELLSNLLKLVGKSIPLTGGRIFSPRHAQNFFKFFEENKDLGKLSIEINDRILSNAHFSCLRLYEESIQRLLPKESFPLSIHDILQKHTDFVEKTLLPDFKERVKGVPPLHHCNVHFALQNLFSRMIGWKVSQKDGVSVSDGILFFKIIQPNQHSSQIVWASAKKKAIQLVEESPIKDKSLVEKARKVFFAVPDPQDIAYFDNLISFFDDFFSRVEKMSKETDTNEFAEIQEFLRELKVSTQLDKEEFQKQVSRKLSVHFQRQNKLIFHCLLDVSIAEKKELLSMKEWQVKKIQKFSEENNVDNTKRLKILNEDIQILNESLSEEEKRFQLYAKTL